MLRRSNGPSLEPDRAKCPTVKVDGNRLEHVTEYKYLGVFLGVNLDWNTDVAHMANTILKQSILSKLAINRDKNKK